MMTLKGEVKDEELAALIGEKIGIGSARTVYKMQGNDCWVIKEGHTEPYASNTTEWNVWQKIAGSEIAPLFGECPAVSVSRRYLVMECLGNLDATDADCVPPMPTWLTDRKRSNLGKATNGDIKARDYAQVRDCANRVNAPKQPWPSADETSAMADLQARLNSI